MSQDRSVALQAQFVKQVQIVGRRREIGSLDQDLPVLIRQEAVRHLQTETGIQHILRRQPQLDPFRGKLFHTSKTILQVTAPVVRQVRHYMRSQENTFHTSLLHRIQSRLHIIGALHTIVHTGQQM